MKKTVFHGTKNIRYFTRHCISRRKTKICRLFIQMHILLKKKYIFSCYEVSNAMFIFLSISCKSLLSDSLSLYSHKIQIKVKSHSKTVKKQYSIYLVKLSPQVLNKHCYYSWDIIFRRLFSKITNITKHKAKYFRFLTKKCTYLKIV